MPAIKVATKAIRVQSFRTGAPFPVPPLFFPFFLLTFHSPAFAIVLFVLCATTSAQILTFSCIHFFFFVNFIATFIIS